MQKNLVNSKKSSTFAPAFVRGAYFFALSGGGRFSRLTGTPPGAIAQLVEQRTENPCVTGSIPVGTTQKNDLSAVLLRLYGHMVESPNNNNRKPLQNIKEI